MRCKRFTNKEEIDCITCAFRSHPLCAIVIDPEFELDFAIAVTMLEHNCSYEKAKRIEMNTRKGDKHDKKES